MKYILWGEPNNVDVTRSLYAKRIGFPFNFIYPQKYIKQTDDLLKIIANFSIDDKIINHNTIELIINAKTFINMLAERFDKRSLFFGGRKPNEVDATIYAALSILLHFPLQNNDIKSHINECPSLVKYTERIRSKYLLGIISPDREQLQPSMLHRMQNVFINKEKGTLSNGMMKVIFGVLTVGSMVFFAVSHGILEIVIDDNDNVNDDRDFQSNDE